MIMDVAVEFEIIIHQFKKLTDAYREAIKETGISESEFWVWYTLIAVDGEYTKRDISSIWSISRQRVDAIVKHMVDTDCAFLDSESPAGSEYIHLTDLGREYGERIVKPIHDIEKKVIAGLPLKDCMACNAVMCRYIHAFREEIYDAREKGQI